MIISRCFFQSSLYILVLIFFCLPLSAQKGMVSGVVHADDGTPLEHVSIKATDGKKVLVTTQSDAKGLFTIKLPATAVELSAQLLGYKAAVLKVSESRTTYHFVLNEQAEKISEAVVTGYVNKRKESYTGASFVIDHETLIRQTNTNLLDMIKNNTPGFELIPNNDYGADPNHIPDMVLRGRSSFVEGDRTNLPLFILDGVETDVRVIFGLQPASIKQVSVLKDAAATAYYGSKAANGVVVITSMPTKAGRLQVDYDGRYQLSVADLSAYRLLNAAEKLEYERMAGIYGDLKGSSQTDLERQKVYYEKLDRVKAGVNTNWLRMPLRTGVTHQHNLSFMGGSDIFRYRLMGGYSGTNGVMQKSNRHTASLYVNLVYGDWTRLFIQYTGRVESALTDDVPYGSFSNYALLNPYDAPYTAAGVLNNELSFGKPNPLYEKSLSSYINSSARTMSNSLRLRWNLGGGLRIEGTAALTETQTDDESFFSPLSQRFLYVEKQKRGSFDILHSRHADISSSIFAVWNKAFGKYGQHLLNLTLGANVQAIEQKSDGFIATGLLSDKVDHASMAKSFAEGSTPQGNRDRARMLGGYINAQYVYDNRYFIDASFRREGSSKFGAQQKYAPFGMLGIGWNVHKESFMTNRVVTLLKIRASAGIVGNVNFHSYQARQAYSYRSDLIYNNQIGAVPTALANTHLRWERTLKRNAGVDFALFDDRVSGSFDAYLNTTNDLVMTVAKPAHTGFLNGKENLGQIRNAGVELSLRGRVFSGRPLGLNVYLTMSHNRNRIVKISDYLRNRNADNVKQGNSRLPVPLYAEGESLTALKVMRSAGINPANGREVFIKRNGEYTYTYDYNERQVVGDTSPRVQGTWGFSATWKDFSLTAAFNYRLGATLYNSTLATKVEGADPLTNVDRRVFYSRWREPGSAALFKHIALREATPPTSRFVAKEYVLEGTSLMLAYQVPSNLCRVCRVADARISLSTGQFFYLSTIKRERGLAYPFAHVFEIGLNVKI